MSQLSEEIDKWKPLFMLFMDVEPLEGISSDAEDLVAEPSDVEEMKQVLFRVVLDRDPIAGEAAARPLLRGVWRGWARNTNAGAIYRGLDKRRAMRRAMAGTPDQRRRPSHSEGVEFAREYLADVSDRSWWERDTQFLVSPSVPDAEQADWTQGILPRLLADAWLSQSGGGDLEALRDFIRNSASSPVFDHALKQIYWALSQGRGEPPHALLLILIEAVAGSQERPLRGAFERHRRAKLGYLGRNVKIVVCLKLLHRVGIPPTGSRVSGCRIVAESLDEMSEDQVRRIGTTPIWPTVRRVLELVIRRWFPEATEES